MSALGTYVDSLQGLSQKQLILLLAREKARQTESLAVIGAACRFPGNVNGLESLWDSLINQDIHVREYPDGPPGALGHRRWDPSRFGNNISLRVGAYLESIDRMPTDFVFAPDEADYIDPQQRLLLECVDETLQSAGLEANSLSGKNVGVFIGVSISEYLDASLRNGVSSESLSPHMATGTSLSAVAGRIAIRLGSQGPAITVDTACSSALTAVHLAKQSIRSGECDWAIVGASQLLLSPFTAIVLEKAGMLSAQGCSRPFDSHADGHVRGEGTGVILLTRESLARAENLNPIASLKGTAIHQQGGRDTLSVSTGTSQVRVMQDALVDAGMTSTDIDYIEAHATGSRMGGIIEMESIRQVYSNQKPIYVGSAKANWGHLEAASGMLSILRCLAILKHRSIPPQMGVDQLDENIDLSDGSIRISFEPVALNDEGSVSCGVSAFGFTGTNAHAIFESCENSTHRHEGFRQREYAHAWPVENIWTQ